MQPDLRHTGVRLFSALFDYVLNFSRTTRPLWMLPVGAAYFALYYDLFRYRAFRSQDPPVAALRGAAVGGGRRRAQNAWHTRSCASFGRGAAGGGRYDREPTGRREIREALARQASTSADDERGAGHARRHHGAGSRLAPARDRLERRTRVLAALGGRANVSSHDIAANRATPRSLTARAAAEPRAAWSCGCLLRAACISSLALPRRRRYRVAARSAGCGAVVTAITRRDIWRERSSQR